MSSKDRRVFTVAVPAQSLIARCYDRPHLADAFAVRLPDDASADPECLARFLFSQQAAWVTGLMKLRDLCASVFGLKTAAHLLRAQQERSSKRIHYFAVVASTPAEIVLGENDKHLDFRLSVLCQDSDDAQHSGRRLVFSTVVSCHNLAGRLYLLLVAPFHRAVVRSGLRRASRANWPGTESCRSQE